MKIKIVLLCGKGDSSNIVFNYINQKYGISYVFEDKEVSRKTFIKRRVKKLGCWKVLGQILFSIIIAKPLKIISEHRILEIVQENHLDINEIPESFVTKGYSVNDDHVRKRLTEIKPDLILVNGTRIISSKIINCVKCPFINLHVGITPKYRGVHGMYWALVNNDEKNCGVTVHYVDDKIDTGSIIYQAYVGHTNEDNFVTYPYLQVVEGLRLLDLAIHDFIKGDMKTTLGSNESHLWSHPTIWQYIYNRIVSGVK